MEMERNEKQSFLSLSLSIALSSLPVDHQDCWITIVASNFVLELYIEHRLALSRIIPALFRVAPPVVLRLHLASSLDNSMLCHFDNMPRQFVDSWNLETEYCRILV